MTATLDRSAVFSEDRRYRFRLDRAWDPSLPRVCFVMLNPSVADDRSDDLTVTKCVGFARSWGFGSLTIANLYALVSTDPLELLRNRDPIGPGNDWHLATAIREADAVVVAWGATLDEVDRRGAGWPGVDFVLERAAAHGRPVSCLGLTRDGYPRHPSRIAYATPRIPFERSSR